MYDREEVLGRDASSVFPTKAKAEANAGGNGQLDADAIREMLGGRKFVTEKEVGCACTCMGCMVGLLSACRDRGQVKPLNCATCGDLCVLKPRRLLALSNTA